MWVALFMQEMKSDSSFFNAGMAFPAAMQSEAGFPDTGEGKDVDN